MAFVVLSSRKSLLAQKPADATFGKREPQQPVSCPNMVMLEESNRERIGKWCLSYFELSWTQ